MLGGCDNYGLPTSIALSLKDVLAPKGVAAVEREAMVEDVENFHKKKLITKTRRYKNTDTEKRKKTVSHRGTEVTKRKEIVFFVCRETPVRSSGPTGQATTNKKFSACGEKTKNRQD